MAGGWFYDSRDGNVGDETGLFGAIGDVLLHAGLGWHGPFRNLQAVVDFYNTNAAANPDWVPPQLGGYLKSNPGLHGVTSAMMGNPGFTQYAKNQLQGSAGAATNTGLATIGDFFSKLGQASTWLRVAEVLLGLGLIVVSLAKLAGDTSIGRTATKIATKAALL